MNFKSIVTTNNSDTFFTKFEELYFKITEAGLEDSEFGMKGSVLYFVVQDNSKNGRSKQTTIGACKIKTLEYQAYEIIKKKAIRYFYKK